MGVRADGAGLDDEVVSGAAGIALVLARIGTADALALAERACDLLVTHAIEAVGLEW